MRVTGVFNTNDTTVPLVGARDGWNGNALARLMSALQSLPGCPHHPVTCVGAGGHPGATRKDRAYDRGPHHKTPGVTPG